MNPCIASISAEVLEGVDALGIQEAIDQSGFWLSPTAIDPDTCAELSGLYEGSEALFRSAVSMARYGFGRGEYKYFGRGSFLWFRARLQSSPSRSDPRRV
jgi:hypothetical protein